VDHLRKRYHRALGKGHGVLYDYQCATYPDERMQRIRMADGSEEVVNVRGRELPAFEFHVGDTPTFSGLEKAKSEALDRLIAVPTEWQEVYAQVNELPPSVLRKVQKKQAELAEQAALLPPGGGVPGQPNQVGDPASALSPDMALPPNGSDPRRAMEAMQGQMPQLSAAQ
jgi:hypothetical protein